MARRTYPPYNESIGKFGLHVSKMDVRGAPNEADNVRTVGWDQANNGGDFFPTYQIGMARNLPYLTSEQAVLWIQTAADTIRRRVLPHGTRLHDCPSWFVDVDLSGMGVLNQQTALAPVERIVSGGNPLLVLALPAAGGGGDYGILVHDSDGITAASPVAPSFTTAQLFTGSFSAPAGGHWRTFAGFQTSSGDIRILASIWTTPSGSPEARDGDFSYLVTFALSSDASSVTSPVEEVSTDVKFDPHQIAAGMLVPLDGSAPSTQLWCAGRHSPNQNLSCGNTGSTVAFPTAVANVGGEGVWVCTTPDTMQGWTRVVYASHSHTQNPEEVQTGQNNAGNTLRAPPVFDVGVLFDESWQRLQFVGTGNDSSQDPHLMDPYHA